MLPWTHAAVGYLLLSALSRRRRGRPPGDAAAVAVGVGTQLPDLIDKPLAWHAGVLPAGRSASHSLLALGLVAAVAVALARRGALAETTGTALVVGYAAHLAGDAVGPLLAGELGEVGYLAWPLVAVDGGGAGYSIFAFLLATEPTPSVLAGVALTAVGAVRWWRDGAPGPALGRRLLGRARSAAGGGE